jgi:hypothetical protein
MRFLGGAGAATPVLILHGCSDTVGGQALICRAAGVGAALVTNGYPVAGGIVGARTNVEVCRLNPGLCLR